MQKFKWWVVLAVLFVLALVLLPKQNSVMRDSKPLKAVDTFSSEKKDEIFYRFVEVYHQVVREDGIDVLPEVGQNEWKQPRKEKAIELVAKEFGTSTDQVKTIIASFDDRDPTEEEYKIFKIYDDKLNKLIDDAGKDGTNIVNKSDEERLASETAQMLGITTSKLNNIWMRVLSWQLSRK